jgi:hypothetical protein
MDIGYQNASDFKTYKPLNIVDAENHDKFEMILDRLERGVIGHITQAASSTDELSLSHLRDLFKDAKVLVKR